MAIRVLIADDNEQIRKAVLRLLETSPDIQPIGEAASFVETIQLVNEHRPEIVVVDMHMPDGQVLLPEQIKSSLNGTRLLAMSLWVDDETKTLAERLGAVALLDKTTLVQELVPAIRRHAANVVS